MNKPIVVMQCSGSKAPEAAKFKSLYGKPVVFVSHPEAIYSNPKDYVFVHPDNRIVNLENATEADLATSSYPELWTRLKALKPRATYRDALVIYNELAHGPSRPNPWNLLPAVKMYARGEYALMLKAVGKSNLFICSAGWGIIRCDFLIPAYDVTFMSSAPRLIKRAVTPNPVLDFDAWKDFNQLPAKTIVSDSKTNGSDDPTGGQSPNPTCSESVRPEIHFFLSKTYSEMVYKLCGDLPGRKIIHYAAYLDFFNENFEYVAHEAHTNWNYSAAKAFALNLLRRQAQGG